MSEKRKPTRTIVAWKEGKQRVRIELFPARLWPQKFGRRALSNKKYRVRVNGRWSQGEHVFTISEVMRQLRGLLK